MSDKFLFENARIKAMESKLLNSQHMQRLAECSSTDEAFKVMLELGFGQGQTVAQGDFDTLIEKEEENAVSLLRAFNVGGALDALLLDADFHNAKALVKAEITGDKPALMPEGLTSVDNIKSAIDGDYDGVSSVLADALADISKKIADGEITSRYVDITLDRATFREQLERAKKGGKKLVSHFVFKIDVANISTFYRTEKIGADVDFFKENFIDGGKIALDVFERCFGSNEALKNELKNTEYFDLFALLADGGSLAQFETEVDNAILGGWKKEFNDLESPSPIVYYYLAKRTEIKVAKLIVAGIKNHVNPSLIKERTREIYGA